jgi:hypothetical protein
MRRLGGDAAAVHAFKMAIRLRDASVRARAMLATLLMERGRATAAERVARSAGDPAHPAIAAVLSTAALSRGDYTGAAEAIGRTNSPEAEPESGPLARNAGILRARTAEPAPLPEKTRHIAIGGVNYVGSTVLGMILGSVPGAAFAGETNWLAEAALAGGCRFCEGECPVFSQEFRDSMLAAPGRWYGRVAERMNTRLLVTADKYFNTYWRRDPYLRFDRLIIYKAPQAQMRSNLKRRLQLGEIAAPADIVPVITRNLNAWATNYLSLLKTPQPHKRVVLNWGRFVAEPGPHLRRIGELLTLEIAGDQHRRLAAQHFLNGNRNIDVKAVAASGRIELHPSDAAELPEEAGALAAAHRRAQYVAALLDRAYARDFGV